MFDRREILEEIQSLSATKELGGLVKKALKAGKVAIPVPSKFEVGVMQHVVKALVAAGIPATYDMGTAGTPPGRGSKYRILVDWMKLKNEN